MKAVVWNEKPRFKYRPPDPENQHHRWILFANWGIHEDGENCTPFGVYVMVYGNSKELTPEQWQEMAMSFSERCIEATCAAADGRVSELVDNATD